MASAAPLFLVRLQTPQGTKRLFFKSNQVTWDEFQVEVKAQTGVLPKDQLLSRTPPHKPSYVESRGGATLASLKIVNGDILHLVSKAPEKKEEKKESAPATPSTGPAPVKLTPRCLHGPKGRCIHCDGVPAGPVEVKEKRACNHGPNAKCMNCSKIDQKAPVAEWLCNHPESVFCPKCIPKESTEGQAPKRMECKCDKSRGQSCNRCIEQKPVIKIDVIPYKRFMEEKQALCKFSHAPTVTCASCAPPKLPSYAGLKECPKGHRPWPAGSCLQCAPANAILRSQPFRYCDSVSFYGPVIHQFYSDWFKKTQGGKTQRAGIMIGSYIDEPAETKNPGAIRALVHCIYEPPQEGLRAGVRFLRDPNERLVHEMATQLGLQPVGWIITTLAREGGPKYGGKVFMSASEVRQAARFQNRYKDENGHSRFISVILEHGKTIEPRAFQVSDQCVALERDGCFGNATDPYMLATKPQKPGELQPKIIYRDKVLEPGTEFLPDDVLVKVILSQASENFSLFKHATFPSGGTDAAMAAHFADYKHENYNDKLSDFNLLCFLPHVCGLETAKQVAAALRTKTPFSAELRSALDTAFLKKNLF